MQASLLLDPVHAWINGCQKNPVFFRCQCSEHDLQKNDELHQYLFPTNSLSTLFLLNEHRFAWRRTLALFWNSPAWFWSHSPSRSSLHLKSENYTMDSARHMKYMYNRVSSCWMNSFCSTGGARTPLEFRLSDIHRALLERLCSWNSPQNQCGLFHWGKSPLRAGLGYMYMYATDTMVSLFFCRLQPSPRVSSTFSPVLCQPEVWPRSLCQLTRYAARLNAASTFCTSAPPPPAFCPFIPIAYPVLALTFLTLLQVLFYRIGPAYTELVLRVQNFFARQLTKFAFFFLVYGTSPVFVLHGLFRLSLCTQRLYLCTQAQCLDPENFALLCYLAVVHNWLRRLGPHFLKSRWGFLFLRCSALMQCTRVVLFSLLNQIFYVLSLALARGHSRIFFVKCIGDA